MTEDIKVVLPNDSEQPQTSLSLILEDEFYPAADFFPSHNKYL